MCCTLYEPAKHNEYNRHCNKMMYWKGPWTATLFSADPTTISSWLANRCLFKPDGPISAIWLIVFTLSTLVAIWERFVSSLCKRPIIDGTPIQLAGICQWYSDLKACFKDRSTASRRGSSKSSSGRPSAALFRLWATILSASRQACFKLAICFELC